MYSFKKLILLSLIKCRGNVFHKFFSGYNPIITFTSVAFQFS